MSAEVAKYVLAFAYVGLVYWLSLKGMRRTKDISGFAIGNKDMNPYLIGITLAASIASTEPASRDNCRWAVDTLIADMRQAGPLVQRLEGTIATLCKKQIEPVLQWPIEWFEQPLLCTLPVGAHWQLHADAETYNAASGFAERQCNRDLTVLLFVDDMPADVTIHWPFFNYRYRASRGDVLVFPSDQRFRYEMAASAQSACTVVLSWLNRVGPARTASLPDGAYRLTDCD